MTHDAGSQIPPQTGNPVPQGNGELITYLQGRRRDSLRAIRACHPENNADYWRWQGHAELSRQLLERLGAEIPS